MLFPLNLDPALLAIGIVFALLLAMARPTMPPPPQVFLVPAPQPLPASGGDVLLGLFIFGILVMALAGFVS